MFDILLNRRRHAPRAELVEVSKHGGAARATLEPNEKWGFGNGGNGGLGFIESVENGRAGGGVDLEIAGPCGESCFREEWGGRIG